MFTCMPTMFGLNYVAAVITPSLDPYFNNVVTLLHIDGANNSTVFTDSSPKHKNFIGASDAKVVTDTSKFGGGSMYVHSQNRSWIYTAENPSDFVFGTGDFTVECYIKTPTVDQVVLDFYAAGQPGWQVYIDSGGHLQWYSISAAKTGLKFLNDNVWHHIAVTRQSGVMNFFIDGVVDGDPAAFPNDLSFQRSWGFAVGAQVDSVQTPTFRFIGNIDEVRITKGVCRYTTNFTPLTEAFPDADPPSVSSTDFNFTEVSAISNDFDLATQ